MSVITLDPPANRDESAVRSIWCAGAHISQLDGVRGLAIAIVTLYRFSKELPTDHWFGRTLHGLFALGDRGVDLFFVLSGFLITGLLLDAKGTSGYFLNFLARRSLRIFPLYFVALAGCLAISAWFPPYRDMFAQARENQFFLWTYMANIKMSLDAAWCFGYLDHFWSLSVEEHFYLVWPFVLFLCTPRVALKVALAMAVGSALSRVMFAAFGDNGVAPDVLTIFRCDALLLGSILAMQIRLPEGLQPLRKLSWIVFPICLTLGLACSVLGIRAWTISHSLWPLLWCCVLIWLLSSSERSWLARFFNNSGLQKLGKYSYGMYVFQNPLIPLSATVCSAPVFIQWFGNPIVGHAVYMAWMFALTFGAALLSWHLLEKHCLRLKVWFPLQPSPATVQVRSAREMLPAIN